VGSNPISSTKIQKKAHYTILRDATQHLYLLLTRFNCSRNRRGDVDRSQPGAPARHARGRGFKSRRSRQFPSLDPSVDARFSPKCVPVAISIMKVVLLRKYAFPKRDSDIYDLFQLHYLACEQFVFVTRDGTLMSKVQQKYAADLLLGGIAQEDDVRCGRSACACQQDA